jgi:anti-sigma B factor antagonist
VTGQQGDHDNDRVPEPARVDDHEDSADQRDGVLDLPASGQPDRHDRPGVKAASTVPDWNVRMCEPAGDGALIAVRGEVDLRNRDRLAAIIREAASRTVGDLILDLADLSFCDATGIDVMVDAHHNLVRAGRHLIIINAGNQLRRLFKLAQAGFLLDMPDRSVQRLAAVPVVAASRDVVRGQRRARSRARVDASGPGDDRDGAHPPSARE